MSNMLAFMAGAADRQSEIWSEQDKRREAYREKMEALYMKGMEERQKEYDTKAEVYNQIKSARANGDNQAAFAAYAKLHPELTAKNMKDTYGGEWEADLSKKEGMLSARMDAAVAQWDSRKRPTLDMENMVVDRATYLQGNEEEYRAHIRDLYSLDPIDDGVLYATKVKGSIFDRVASEGDGDSKWRPDAYDEVSRDGSTTRVFGMRNQTTGQFVETQRSGKKTPKAEDAITKYESNTINEQIQRGLDSLDPKSKTAKGANDLWENDKERVQIAVENGYTVLKDQNRDADPATIARQVADDFFYWAKQGMVDYKDTWFGLSGEGTSTYVVPLYTRDGQGNPDQFVAEVPFYDAQDYIDQNGYIAVFGNR